MSQEIIKTLATLTAPDAEKEEKVYQKFQSFLKNKLAENRRPFVVKFSCDVEFFEGYILPDQIEKFTERAMEKFGCIKSMSFIIGSIEIAFITNLKYN